MIRKILASTNPKLRETSKPVAKIDKKVKNLITDLKDTLATQKDPEGVGLAAPQIGKNVRIFIISFNGLNRVVVNPEVIDSSFKKTLDAKPKSGGKIMEGCLSLPHYYGGIKRNNLVKIKYLDENGQEKIEEFKDFFAQIVLHEIDHLNGILFVDRLLEQKKKLFKLDGNEWEEVELI